MCLSKKIIRLYDGPVPVDVPIACGNCWQCDLTRQNDYVGRSLAEASVSDWVLSVTLTYAPREDLSDQIITPVHFQKFIRSLRRRGHVVRYLVCGERGELRGRAHFHAVLFGKGKRPEIAHKENDHHPSWPHGHVFGDWSADERAVKYVCKYLHKSAGLPAGDFWFSVSKKPPLGADFFALKAKEAVSLGVLPSTFAYAPPGGDRGVTYTMRGATRRDYIKAVVAGWREQRPLDLDRCSEWVRNAIERQDLQDEIEWREAYAQTPEGAAYVTEAMLERLEEARPSPAAIRRNFFLTIPDPE